MPIFAELQDGRRLEFPDGTAPEVIQSTVRKMLAAPKTEAPTVGAGQAALIAAGRGTDKLVQGVRQVFNWATGDQATLDQMAADEADKDRLYQPLKDKHPVATGVGGMAPALAVGLATGGTSVLGAAGANALPALLSYGGVEDRVKGAAVDALGGAVGAKAGQLVARTLKPAGVGAVGVSDDALKAAKNIGYKPTAAQITQNPGMMNFENYLARAPGSSGAMQSVTQSNQTALNRAGAKAMGETADNLGEDVFAAARARIGSEFDRLGAVTKPDLQGGFLNALAKVDADNMARGSFANKEVNSLVDKALDLAAKNNLDGKAYKEIRTEMANRAQAAFKAGDATTGQAYKAVYGALDDAAKSSLSKSDQAAWDFARDQWKAFKTLSKSNVAEAGNVSAPRTAAAVRTQNPMAFRTGAMNGPMADIARIGEAFKSVPNPNSGNQVIGSMMSNPITGIPLALGNRAAAAAYMNPLMQRYLARGIVDVGDEGLGLLSRAGQTALVPSLRGLLGAE